MIEWTARGRSFRIRDARSEADYHAIEHIQIEAWRFADLDVVSLGILVASQAAGAILLCAFEGERMIGFAYCFPAYEHGAVSMHSHMLAVRPDARNFQVGSRLKLAQRRRALDLGLSEISWTFDPLQSRNAHLNFSKLGVVSRRYLVDFYGEASSSPLHQGYGTDRLWVTWPLSSERVTRRIDRILGDESLEPRAHLAGPPPEAPFLVRAEGDLPRLADLDASPAPAACLIEIPEDVNALKERDPAAGTAWREATRRAMLRALDSGLYVADFIRLESERGPIRAYLLIR